MFRERFLKYSIKSLRGRLSRSVLIAISISVCFYFLIAEFESYENRTVVFLMSPIPFRREEIEGITHQAGVIYSSKISYRALGNITLYKVDADFWKFALRYVVKGRLPAGTSEAALIYRFGLRLQIGDSLKVENQSYIVSGFLSEGGFSLLSDSWYTLITSSSDPSDVRIIVLGVSGFTNVTALVLNTQRLVSEKQLVILADKESSSTLQTFLLYISVGGVFIVFSALNFLHVSDTLPECTILLSLGWSTSNIYTHIVITGFALYAFGVTLGSSVSYVTIPLIFKYFIIPTLFWVIILFVMLFGVLSTYILSKLLLQTKLIYETLKGG